MVATLSGPPRGAVAGRANWPHPALLDVLSAAPSNAPSAEAESDEQDRSEARSAAEPPSAAGSPLTAHLAVEAAQRPAQVQQNQALSADAARRAPARSDGQLAERAGRAQFRAALADAQQRSTAQHAPESSSVQAPTATKAENAPRGGAEAPTGAPGDKAGSAAKTQNPVPAAAPSPASLAPPMTAAESAIAQPPAAGTDLNRPGPSGAAAGSSTARVDVAIQDKSATPVAAAAAAPIHPAGNAPPIEPSTIPAARGGGPAPTSAGAAPAQTGSVGDAGGGRSTTPAAPAAAARPAKPPTSSAPGENDANIEQIVRWARSRIEGQRSTTVMRLDPPLLGTLRLRLDLDHGAAALTVDADQPLAQRLLTEHLDTLQRGFEAAGMRLEHVEVRLAADPQRAALDGGYDADDARGQPPPQERPDEQPGEPRTRREADGFAASAEPPVARVEGDDPAPRGVSRVNLWV